MRRLPALTLTCMSALAALSGCSWHSYVLSRAVRHVTGATTRFHPVVPLKGALDRYRVVEVRKFDNLLLGQLPPPMEQYINERIVSELGSVKSKPEIVRLDEESLPGQEAQPEDSGTPPTLVLEGYIDDYDGGYAGLRLVELGFNHVAVTVRFQLRDKQTGEVLGAASITSQDNRITASTRTAVNKIAKRIKGFMDSGYRSSK